jgi:hypothetical protein
VQASKPFRVVNNSNPFAKADNCNQIMKKLDFSRLSNPEITLFPE